MNVVIIGGGPSGLFCALRTAEQGRPVLVLEKMASCGKKLLLTGLGQCNITHDGDIRSFPERYGPNGAFLRPALLNFTNSDLIAFFEERGVPMITEESGKVFPRSRSASDILDLLLSECRDTGVEIRYGEGVSRVTVDDDQSFSVLSARSSYRATDLVIATGGASYPSTGSTGDGYRLAESLGHTITTPAPALAPIYPDTYLFSRLSGISFPGTTLTLYRQGRKVMQLSGDLLLTHTGLSGPGILHMSRYAEPGDTLQVSFLADRSATDLTREFVAGASSEGQRLVRSFLPEYKLPARFIESILTQAGIPGTRTLAHLTKTERNRLVLLLSAYRFRVTRVGGYDEAMVTRGGICVQEVDPKTMQSRLRKRLYAIGEVLDIDGDAGGYNLQAAFSTAESAAKAILAK